MDKLITLVLAVDERNGLWKNQTLAWKLSSDMKYFKEITSATLSSSKQNAVIMGRKTWESIPPKFRPLGWRVNCILSRHSPVEEGNFLYSSLEGAIEELKKNDSIESIHIIGGAQIYNEAISKGIPQTIYLTQVHWDFGCDVFFSWVPENYDLMSMSDMQEENGIQYQFCVYEKMREIKPLTSWKALWETEAPSIISTDTE